MPTVTKGLGTNPVIPIVVEGRFGAEGRINDVPVEHEPQGIPHIAGTVQVIEGVLKILVVLSVGAH
jgi:hypothetical protein